MTHPQRDALLAVMTYIMISESILPSWWYVASLETHLQGGYYWDMPHGSTFGPKESMELENTYQNRS